MSKKQRYIVIYSVFALSFLAAVFVTKAYYGFPIFNAIKNTVVVALSGVAICFSGAIFQTTYKNPLATPNLLGVTTGVSLGNIAFVLFFGLQAYSYLQYRYIFCYVLAAAMVCLTVFFGRISGKKAEGFSVEMMIIIGMIITSIGQVFISYYNFKITMDEDGLAEIYTMLTSGNSIFIDNKSMISFFVVFIITTVPMLLLRYRYNVVVFPDDEVRAMGINSSLIRVLGLVLGSFMSAAAVIHGGDLGFLAMVIPFVCRKKLHAEFGEVAITSMGLGGALTLLARVACYLFAYIGVPVNAGAIVTLVALPVFILSLIKKGDGYV